MFPQRRWPAPVRNARSGTASRKVVSDLFARRAWIYWVDFGVTYTVFVAAVILGGWSLSWWSLLALPIAALALYRCGGFIHEIQHFRKGELGSFVVVWNTLFGCPLATPSVLYSMHGRHHSVVKYGTNEDSEYPNIPHPLPMGRVLLAILMAARVQLVYVARFTAGTLTRWVRPSLRKRMETGWSELPMDGIHKRPEFTDEEERYWLPFELLSMFYMVLIAALLIAQIIPVTLVVFVFLAVIGANYTNFLRVLVVHTNEPRTVSRSFDEQIEDSFDHPNAFVKFWGPVGLGYHGTHHLFPTMPYHALGRAHRRLVDDPDSVALISVMTRPGLLRSLRTLVG